MLVLRRRSAPRPFPYPAFTWWASWPCCLLRRPKAARCRKNSHTEIARVHALRVTIRRFMPLRALHAGLLFVTVLISCKAGRLLFSERNKVTDRSSPLVGVTSLAFGKITNALNFRRMPQLDMP